ncbi:MAG TPA: thiamine-phosphate kinase [Tepidisphaeraceae bacterium]|jgi:thiamine-monophosphate kinase
MALSARSQASSKIREFDLIAALNRRYGTTGSGIVRGIGDDAAVIASSRTRRYLLTTDLLAEGIHFNCRTAAFTDIGFRAAIANLSDIAAMGGTPEYVLVSLAMPRGSTGRQVEQFYQGMMAACRPHRVKLIGGDTSASKDGWFVNIMLIGSCDSGRILFRSGARAGDDLYVTGTLGDSRAGLHLLHAMRDRTRARCLTAAQRRFLIQRHLRPAARIREGRWLSKARWATAAIDLSDGLSGDLRHLCEASGVGAIVEPASLPMSAACRRYALCLKQGPEALALAGGEDYELLFTVPARLRNRFERAAAHQPLRISRVGRMTPAKEGLRVMLPDGRRRPLPLSSYEHFRSRPST